MNRGYVMDTDTVSLQCKLRIKDELKFVFFLVARANDAKP
jgi:hypothetical protein